MTSALLRPDDAVIAAHLGRSQDLLEDGDVEFNMATWTGMRDASAWAGRARPQDARIALETLSGKALRRYNEARKNWHANLGPYLTEAVREVARELDELVDSSRQDSDKAKPGAYIVAPGGLGKTSFVLHWAKQFHRRQLRDYGELTSRLLYRIPVVYLPLDAKSTIKSFNRDLCTLYGVADDDDTTGLGQQAATTARACKTRVLIVDDIHFLQRGAWRETLINHLKNTASRMGVVIIIVGVGSEEENLLTALGSNSDAWLQQLGRRAGKPYVLSPLGIADEPGRKTWRSTLLAVERDLVLAELRPGLLADELSDYLYARSTGHFASLMHLLRVGAVRAIEKGTETLTVELLDGIRNDADAERQRQELAAKLDSGLLVSKPARKARR